MKKLIRTSVGNSILFFLALLLFLLAGITCNNGLNSEGVNTGGAGQILVTINPPTVFGNGDENRTKVQVNTGQIPDGSIINIEITGSSLPPELRGCVINVTSPIVNGQAFADYINAILIGPGVSGATEPTATVNIAATITTSDGTKESRFGKVTINGVDLIPPAAQTLTTNPADSKIIQFLDIIFQTIGIPPGTEVSVSVSNNNIGGFTSKFNPTTSTSVIGSEDSGSVITEYDGINGTGGTQVITADIVLPNPHDIDPSCPDVPADERTIQAAVTITQSVPAPTPTPPVPTPTPAPTIKVAAKPSGVLGNQQALITATTTGLNPGTQICFDFGSPVINSTPASSINPTSPTCTTTDANGNALAILTAGNVTSPPNQIITVRACVGTCPGTLNATTSVTICPTGASSCP